MGAAGGAALDEKTKIEDEKKKLAASSSKYFPNHVLLTQDNQPVRFYEEMLKGKVVLINFMFTTCTGVCSPMTANMAKVQGYLGERVGREVRMLSISVDPTRHAEALKAYAEKHKGGGWYFLTQEETGVGAVQARRYTADKAAHSGVLIIATRRRRLDENHAMSKPSEISAAVIR